MEILNDLFNQAMDIALIVATRLGEIPSIVVLLFVAVVVSLIFGVKWMLGRTRRPNKPLKKKFIAVLSVSLAICAALHMVQRTELLLRESRELQYYVRKNAILETSEVLSEEGKRCSFDSLNAQEALSILFKTTVDFSKKRLSEGVEFASFHAQGAKPLSGYVTVIDLSNSALNIEINGETDFKSLTSQFALDRDCIVAINGEAGTSPSRKADLGSYSGFCMVNGARLERETNHWRPFLCFDKENKGWYVRVKDSRTDPGPEVHNAFWGRGDLLVDGQYHPEKNPRWDQASPRTLMGLNKEGDKLILLVIDGRQIGYSVGADHRTAADLMKLFGAENAMWCDQGGSSAMYVQNIAAIVNRPSDGKERPVYTHFGISGR